MATETKVDKLDAVYEVSDIVHEVVSEFEKKLVKEKMEDVFQNLAFGDFEKIMRECEHDILICRSLQREIITYVKKRETEILAKNTIPLMEEIPK